MKAFVLRISPSGLDKVREALDSDQLIIGWSKSAGLLDPELKWSDFRNIMSETYYENSQNLRKAGAASGHMWRFIRTMEVGDFVVVPHGSRFYVARISGPAIYREDKVTEDSAYRRDVQWLNGKKPIERKYAKAALISRMKIQGTSASATDLIDQINDCLELAQFEEKPTFDSDLRQRLIAQTLDELRNGRIDSFAFEHLIKDVLIGLGATEALVIARNKDKGADVIATFMVAGMFPQKVAVQAKHWQATPPVGSSVVMDLINGLESESAQYGMIITTGTISEAASQKALEYYESTGTSIELIDGEQFAALVVEHYVAKS
ncbi:MAG: restriction endonuclease [Gammaproteobacteria bacterium]|nr:restriction endonuclease [Gammaproteobacteria bacterium]